MDKISPPVKSQDHPFLRRRNSISTSVVVSPTKLTLGDRNSSSNIFFSSFASDDLELLSIKPTTHTYSSLKDLLPSVTAFNSPKPKSADICIRNRLVKQAAWAYLRPMSAAPGSTGGNIFHRFWRRVTTVVDLLCRNVVRAFDGTFRVVGIRSFGLQRSKMCLI